MALPKKKESTCGSKRKRKNGWMAPAMQVIKRGCVAGIRLLNAKVDSVPGPASKHSSHGGFPDMQDPSPHGPGLVENRIVDLRGRKIKNWEIWPKCHGRARSDAS